MNKFFLNVVFLSNINISQYEDLSDDIDKFENLVFRTADKYTSNYSVKAVKEKNFISVFIFEYFSKLYMEKVISNLGHIKANKDFYIAAKSQEINHRYLIVNVKLNDLAKSIKLLSLLRYFFCMVYLLCIFIISNMFIG